MFHEHFKVHTSKPKSILFLYKPAHVIFCVLLSPFKHTWVTLILKAWEGTPAGDTCAFGVLIHRLPILMTNPTSHVTSDGGERMDLERVCGQH